MTQREHHRREEYYDEHGHSQHRPAHHGEHIHEQPTEPLVTEHSAHVGHHHAPVVEPVAVRQVVYEEPVPVIHSAALHRLAALNRFRNAVYFVASAIAIVILFRFILLMMGANPANTFANMVYTLSYPFVMPFLGIFGTEPQYGNSVFEFSALIAIAVYFLIAWAIVKIAALVYAPDDPTGHSYHT